jgi:hypothetical protein
MQFFEFFGTFGVLGARAVEFRYSSNVKKGHAKGSCSRADTHKVSLTENALEY